MLEISRLAISESGIRMKIRTSLRLKQRTLNPKELSLNLSLFLCLSFSLSLRATEDFGVPLLQSAKTEGFEFLIPLGSNLPNYNTNRK